MLILTINYSQFMIYCCKQRLGDNFSFYMNLVCVYNKIYSILIIMNDYSTGFWSNRKEKEKRKILSIVRSCALEKSN
jgi:hypothetical protein